MSESRAARCAKAFPGDKRYQQRAQQALPLLVRQAQAQQTISYEDLARELRMPNPRNLDFVLGSVGKTLLKISSEMQQSIPPIQCLVVRKSDGLPGDGIESFIADGDYKKMSQKERRALVAKHLHSVFTYQHWDEVLKALSMEPARADFSDIIEKASRGGWAGGESEKHRALKNFVAANPQVLNLTGKIGNGKMEVGLPSGDKLDVLFCRGNDRIAVEVKSSISSDEDLVRGLFQCIKYQAVLEAQLLSSGMKGDVLTFLVTTRPLSQELQQLKNILGVHVMKLDQSCEIHIP